MLSVLARLLHSCAVLRGADENIFSVCLLLQQLHVLSYTFFTVSMEEGKGKKSSLQSLTPQLF